MYHVYADVQQLFVLEAAVGALHILLFPNLIFT